MRFLLFPAFAVALMGQSTSPAALNLGDSMPTFSLPKLDGNTLNANWIQGPVLVVFLSTQCPTVLATEDRINALAKTFAGTVAVLGINSNDSGRTGKKEEGMEGMKARAKEKKYPFIYMKDASQVVARAFGAAVTPDFFLFNQGKLVYHGRLDDNAFKTEDVTRHELFEAIEALESGHAPKPDQSPALGCPITWKPQQQHQPAKVKPK